MRSRAAQFLVALALIVSIGGHWSVLQSAAWVGMLVNYSKSESVERAIVKTFDGQHPCKLCRMVAAGKKEEKRQESLELEKKITLASVSQEPMIFAGPVRMSILPRPESSTVRFSPPPLPPPRRITA